MAKPVPPTESRHFLGLLDLARAPDHITYHDPMFEDARWRVWFWLTGMKINRRDLSDAQQKSLAHLNAAVTEADLEAWYAAADVVRAANVLGSLPEFVRALAESIPGWSWGDPIRLAIHFARLRCKRLSGELSPLDESTVRDLPGWFW